MRRSGREIRALASEASRRAPKTGGQPKCGAPTKLGGICRAPGTFPDSRCGFHTTTVSAKTKRAWQERGRKSAQRAREPIAFPKADFRDPESVQELLEAVTDALLQGKLPVSHARAISSLAGAAAKLTDVKIADE